MDEDLLEAGRPTCWCASFLVDGSCPNWCNTCKGNDVGFALNQQKPLCCIQPGLHTFTKLSNSHVMDLLLYNELPLFDKQRNEIYFSKEAVSAMSKLITNIGNKNTSHCGLVPSVYEMTQQLEQNHSQETRILTIDDSKIKVVRYVFVKVSPDMEVHPRIEFEMDSLTKDLKTETRNVTQEFEKIGKVYTYTSPRWPRANFSTCATLFNMCHLTRFIKVLEQVKKAEPPPRQLIELDTTPLDTDADRLLTFVDEESGAGDEKQEDEGSTHDSSIFHVSEDVPDSGGYSNGEDSQSFDNSSSNITSDDEGIFSNSLDVPTQLSQQDTTPVVSPRDSFNTTTMDSSQKSAQDKSEKKSADLPEENNTLFFNPSLQNQGPTLTDKEKDVLRTQCLPYFSSNKATKLKIDVPLGKKIQVQITICGWAYAP